MKAVELFAGIGGFRIACDNSAIKTVWANDLSGKACSVYRDRFGSNEIQEADFLAVKGLIPPHELLTGGFPCQPFSSAGKKNGIRDSRGTLFQYIVETLKMHRPRFFVLENVKRLLTMEAGRHFATILTALAELDYFVEWRLLNAMHFGLPQNRERVFIIGTLVNLSSKKPVSEDNVLAKLTRPQEWNLNRIGNGKLFDLDLWCPISRHKRSFNEWGLAFKGRFISGELECFSEASEIIKLSQVLETNVAIEFDFTDSTLKWLKKNTPVNRFVNGVEILSNQKGGARMGYTIFGVNGVAPTLTSTTSRHYERYKIGERYRRLTNIEYARIQGFPDEHCRKVSVYDQYGLYGNAVPPPMAQWVIRQLKSEGVSRSDLSSTAEGSYSGMLFDYV
jgi:DNA (cytosine-5)-methyltransferase 1